MTTALVLPRELTIYTVGELREAWLAWIAGADGETAAADGSAVEDVDAAGVQLLLSLAHALRLQQRGLQLTQPSTPLVAACAALGVQAVLLQPHATGDRP